jgi:hypothetical protein
MTRRYSHLAPDHLRSEVAKTESRAQRMRVFSLSKAQLRHMR